MIKFENVNVTMQGKRILSDINLEIQDGEFVLICGESGCGKTTMTKLINGLIPHFVRDVSVDGTITVCGKNVAEMPMYEIAELVGSVFQNPRTQFFYTNSNAEMAFGLENRGVEPEYIRKRIKNTINELDIEKLEDRDVFSMSGGEKQRLAMARALSRQAGVCFFMLKIQAIPHMVESFFTVNDICCCPKICGLCRVSAVFSGNRRFALRLCARCRYNAPRGSDLWPRRLR